MTSGSVMAEVIRVGADNYAVRLTSEAKTHKAIRSELVDSIRKVSKFTSFVIIPLGIILFWKHCSSAMLLSKFLLLHLQQLC